jgi:hypothetical protein
VYLDRPGGLPAPAQCHTPGAFDPVTRRCTSTALPDGTSCNDGSACTQTDTCQAGVCVGSNPVECQPPPPGAECQPAACNPTDGQCVMVPAPDGTSCSDGDACTQTDTCQGGTCIGSNPVVCPPGNTWCRSAGMCDRWTGQCQSWTADDGSYCDDGNGCTLGDTCHGGECTGGNPVVCAGEGDCYQAGTCSPTSGQCSYPAKSEGASCDDRNPCTQNDTCQAGACSGTSSGGTCEAATGAWLAAGSSHTCALRPDGTVACWGANYFGESSPPLGTFKQVTANNSYACALHTDGTPQCWGTNQSGQTNARTGPYTQLASGGHTACGLTPSGLPECWGDHYYAWPSGTLTQISLGEGYGCGLRGDGSIACWGANWLGQSSPPPGSGYRKVAAGDQHGCAINAEGSVVCWGSQLSTPPPAGQFVDLASVGYCGPSVGPDGNILRSRGGSGSLRTRFQRDRRVLGAGLCIACSRGFVPPRGRRHLWPVRNQIGWLARVLELRLERRWPAADSHRHVHAARGGGQRGLCREG